ncbi:ankyrin repeat domain-containing protein, partial [archaeon]
MQNALNTLKQEQGCSSEEITALLSCTREEDGASPLHVASSYGHSDVIRTLVVSGADLSLRGRKGDYQDKTPYGCCGSGQAREVFEVLFFEQIAVGHAALVQRLLKGGLSPNTTDRSATLDSALHWAVAFGHADISALLLRTGANVHYCNARGESALALAVKHAHVDIVQ